VKSYQSQPERRFAVAEEPEAAAAAAGVVLQRHPILVLLLHHHSERVPAPQRWQTNRPAPVRVALVWAESAPWWEPAVRAAPFQAEGLHQRPRRHTTPCHCTCDESRP
jgi:hypothetical protein